MTNIPTTLLPAIYSLNGMLRKFWPEHAIRNEIPLAFWYIGDDDLLFDALQYFPGHVFAHSGWSGQGHTEEDIENLPEGLRIVIAIFHLEDEFANEGWAGLGNLGDEGVARVIDAYEKVGLHDRAKTLKRVHAAFQQDPEDECALKKAAGGALPDLVDDDNAFQVIARFVRDGQEDLFGTVPGDDA